MFLFFGLKGILAPWSGIKPAPPTLEGEVLTPELPEVKVIQLCPTLCDPMNCSLPDSSVHGILQTRILEWVAIPSSKGSFQPMDWYQVAHIEGRYFTIWATGMPLKLPQIVTFKILKACIWIPPPRPRVCLGPQCDWTQRWSSQVSFCGLLSLPMTHDASFKACVFYCFRLWAALFPWNWIVGRTLNLWWKWPTYRENVYLLFPSPRLH